MNYKTTNELLNFNFSEAVIGDIQAVSGFFHVVFDNVTIMPDNSCNRDIREMRANELVFKIENPEIKSFIKEGYKIYNADGKLMNQYEDTMIAEADYASILKGLIEGIVYSLEKVNDVYIFTIDTEESTYVLSVAGTTDTQEWDRFLNKEA